MEPLHAPFESCTHLHNFGFLNSRFDDTVHSMHATSKDRFYNGMLTRMDINGAELGPGWFCSFMIYHFINF